MHIDSPQFSRWPWVTDPDLGSCRFCQMVLTAICKRPHSKIPYGSLISRLRENRFKFWHGVFCELLSRPINKTKMTGGQGRWPRDLRKLGWFSCALLLEKSVCLQSCGQLLNKCTNPEPLISAQTMKFCISKSKSPDYCHNFLRYINAFI